MPIVEHWEDIREDQHFLLWQQCRRVKSEYLRVTRIDKKRTQDRYVKRMKELDEELTRSTIDKLKEREQTEVLSELDTLYRDNELIAQRLINQTLVSMTESISNAQALGHEQDLKTMVVLLKTLESYAPKKQVDSTKNNTLWQLLSTNSSSNEDLHELQQSNQAAAQLQLPSSAL